VRPLLKWAGGKRQLLPEFRRFYPTAFARYYEPFVGSAAVFFDLHASGRLEGRPAQLSDSSPDLIGCYQAVRDRPAAVIAALRRLDSGHRAGSARHYYEVRERFNRLRTSSSRATTSYTPSLAAMLIYLNRTGYNGLFRLNAAGRFNVPAGRYVRPTICDPVVIRTVAAALQPVTLRRCAFDEAVADARSGDYIYFDPPYAPLSATSAFASYTAARFTDADQQRLATLAVDLARVGCAVMVSNSSAASILALYQRAASASGARLRLWRLPARRAINSRAASRGTVDELLLTNLEPGPGGECPGGAGGR
jgi:DNA adenine methylase